MTDSDSATERASSRPIKTDDIHAAAHSVPYAGTISPADIVIIAYLIIIAALVLMAIDRAGYWPQIVSGHAAGIAVVVIAAKASTRVPARLSLAVAFARAWYPLLLIPLVYKELEYLIPILHPRDFDWELAAIDYRMFGAHPTVWLERFTWPLLTEILQLSYITYYFLPVALGVVLWYKGLFELFHFFLFVVVLGFVLSYLGYIAVPAIGPRFILADQQTMPLKGLLFFETIRETLDRMEGITRDCFPSGHTELTLLVLYYARKFHRPTFWWVLPPGSLLILSTVYLRYHYVIDIIAGALLALAIIIAARPLYKAIGGRL